MTKIIEVNEAVPELEFNALGRYFPETDTVYMYSKDTLYKVVKAHELLHAEHYRKNKFVNFIWVQLEKLMIPSAIIGMIVMLFSSWMDNETLVPISILFFMPIMVHAGFNEFEERRTYKMIHQKLKAGEI